MPERRNKWNFKRWRRRWRDRLAMLALHSRIWVDRHVLSHEKRRQWRRRWKRRSEKISRAVENAGYKVLPHRPDAASDTPWTRFLKRIDGFVDQRIYPPEIRARHGHEFRRWWHQFTAPFRHANARVRHWLGNYFLPALTPAGFRKAFFNWKGYTGAVALAGFSCFVFFWLFPQWRFHNDAKRAAQARLLLNRGYQSMAYQHAVRVLQHNDRNEEAGRVLADMLERQGLAEALVWRRKVAENANSTTNQLALAATALKFEPSPHPTARRILGSINNAATNSLQFHVVAAQFEVRNGNLPAAEGRYLAALKLEPANADVELALAQLRLQTRIPAKVAQAEASLNSLSQRTNMTVRALRPLVMVACSRGDFDAASEHSQRILADESSTFDDRLAHLDVLTRKRDVESTAFRNLLQEQVSANPLYVAQLGSWMTAHNQAREAIAWFKRLPAAIQRSDLVLIATSDAYVAESDWQGLEHFLLQQPPRGIDQRGWGTIEFVRQALLARAYRGLGERRAFTDNFLRAKELASGMAVRLTSLTRLVSTWGWEPEVDDLLWSIFDRFPKEAWAADSLLKRYYERKNTDGIRRVFALQLRRSPNDALLKNNLAMILLLQGSDLPTAHRLALESHQQSPASAVNTSTYAFSLCVQGKPKEARMTMETLDPEVLKVPSIAAYFALITEAAGDKKTARQYIGLARQANLLPEEENLLDALRQRL